MELAAGSSRASFPDGGGNRRRTTPVGPSLSRAVKIGIVGDANNASHWVLRLPEDPHLPLGRAGGHPSAEFFVKSRIGGAETIVRHGEPTTRIPGWLGGGQGRRFRSLPYTAKSSLHQTEQLCSVCGVPTANRP
jgi:hypothetical protein